MKEIRLRVLFGVFIYMLLVCICSFISYNELLNKMIALLVIALSAAYVYKCRNSTLLLVSVFIAYSNYSIAVGVYLVPELRSEYLYPQIVDVQVYGIGIALMMLFMVAVLIFLPPGISKKEENFLSNFIKPENYNKPLFLLLTIVFFLILVFGYTRTSDGRGTSSAIYEYAVVILIFMFYYSGDNKYFRFICYICAILYVSTSLMNGTRIEALSCLLVVYLCTVRKKVPVGLLLSVFFVGSVIMNFVGMLRGNYDSLSTGLKEAAAGLWKSKFVFDTCTYAYFPSLCMIEQFKEYSLQDGMYFFSRFIQTIIKGQLRVPDGDLIAYVREIYFHNYGGVTIGFFYVWFSYLGSLVYGWIVGFYAKFINETDKESAPVKQCAMLYFVATVPRWYLYGPWSFTRGILLCCIAFTVVKISQKMLFTRRVRKKQRMKVIT